MMVFYKNEESFLHSDSDIQKAQQNIFIVNMDFARFPSKWCNGDVCSQKIYVHVNFTY